MSQESESEFFYSSTKSEVSEEFKKLLYELIDIKDNLNEWEYDFIASLETRMIDTEEKKRPLYLSEKQREVIRKLTNKYLLSQSSEYGV